MQSNSLHKGSVGSVTSVVVVVAAAAVVVVAAVVAVVVVVGAVIVAVIIVVFSCRRRGQQVLAIHRITLLTWMLNQTPWTLNHQFAAPSS